MDRLLRSLWRLAKVAAVVGAVVAGLVWVSKRRAREEPRVAPPVWPPLPADEPVATQVTGEAVAEEAEAAEEPAAGDHVEPVAEETEGADPVMWVLPKDGSCPEGYPVKAKVASRIYHVPGGTSYARTSPDRCYATPADAETDGFRPAKR